MFAEEGGEESASRARLANEYIEWRTTTAGGKGGSVPVPRTRNFYAACATRPHGPAKGEEKTFGVEDVDGGRGVDRSADAYPEYWERHTSSGQRAGVNGALKHAFAQLGLSLGDPSAAQSVDTAFSIGCMSTAGFMHSATRDARRVLEPLMEAIADLYTKRRVAAAHPAGAPEKPGATADVREAVRAIAALLCDAADVCILHADGLVVPLAPANGNGEGKPLWEEGRDGGWLVDGMGANMAQDLYDRVVAGYVRVSPATAAADTATGGCGPDDASPRVYRLHQPLEDRIDAYVKLYARTNELTLKDLYDRVADSARCVSEGDLLNLILATVDCTVGATFITWSADCLQDPRGHSNVVRSTDTAVEHIKALIMPPPPAAAPSPGTYLTQGLSAVGRTAYDTSAADWNEATDLASAAVELAGGVMAALTNPIRRSGAGTDSSAAVTVGTLAWMGVDGYEKAQSAEAASVAADRLHVLSGDSFADAMAAAIAAYTVEHVVAQPGAWAAMGCSLATSAHFGLVSLENSAAVLLQSGSDGGGAIAEGITAFEQARVHATSVRTERCLNAPIRLEELRARHRHSTERHRDNDADGVSNSRITDSFSACFASADAACPASNLSAAAVAVLNPVHRESIYRAGFAYSWKRPSDAPAYARPVAHLLAASVRERIADDDAMWSTVLDTDAPAKGVPDNVMPPRPALDWRSHLMVLRGLLSAPTRLVSSNLARISATLGTPANAAFGEKLLRELTALPDVLAEGLVGPFMKPAHVCARPVSAMVTDWTFQKGVPGALATATNDLFAAPVAAAAAAPFSGASAAAAESADAKKTSARDAFFAAAAASFSGASAAAAESADAKKTSARAESRRETSSVFIPSHSAMQANFATDEEGNSYRVADYPDSDGDYSDSYHDYYSSGDEGDDDVGAVFSSAASSMDVATPRPAGGTATAAEVLAKVSVALAEKKYLLDERVEALFRRGDVLHLGGRGILGVLAANQKRAMGLSTNIADEAVQFGANAQKCRPVPTTPAHNADASALVDCMARAIAQTAAPNTGGLMLFANGLVSSVRAPLAELFDDGGDDGEKPWKGPTRGDIARIFRDRLKELPLGALGFVKSVSPSLSRPSSAVPRANAEGGYVEAGRVHSTFSKAPAPSIYEQIEVDFAGSHDPLDASLVTSVLHKAQLNNDETSRALSTSVFTDSVGRLPPNSLLASQWPEGAWAARSTSVREEAVSVAADMATSDCMAILASNTPCALFTNSTCAVFTSHLMGILDAASAAGISPAIAVAKAIAGVHDESALAKDVPLLVTTYGEQCRGLVDAPAVATAAAPANFSLLADDIRWAPSRIFLRALVLFERQQAREAAASYCSPYAKQRAQYVVYPTRTILPDIGLMNTGSPLPPAFTVRSRKDKWVRDACNMPEVTGRGMHLQPTGLLHTPETSRQVIGLSYNESTARAVSVPAKQTTEAGVVPTVVMQACAAMPANITTAAWIAAATTVSSYHRRVSLLPAPGAIDVASGDSWPRALVGMQGITAGQTAVRALKWEAGDVGQNAEEGLPTKFFAANGKGSLLASQARIVWGRLFGSASSDVNTSTSGMVGLGPLAPNDGAVVPPLASLRGSLAFRTRQRAAWDATVLGAPFSRRVGAAVFIAPSFDVLAGLCDLLASAATTQGGFGRVAAYACIAAIAYLDAVWHTTDLRARVVCEAIEAFDNVWEFKPRIDSRAAMDALIAGDSQSALVLKRGYVFALPYADAVTAKYMLAPKNGGDTTTPRPITVVPIDPHMHTAILGYIQALAPTVPSLTNALEDYTMRALYHRRKVD